MFFGYTRVTAEVEAKQDGEQARDDDNEADAGRTGLSRATSREGVDRSMAGCWRG